jgi:hypothetical protein|tara:strand:- start:450 stop:719 length:270 start_codon:yes stop_codon:yes gene_type:complete
VGAKRPHPWELKKGSRTEGAAPEGTEERLLRRIVSITARLVKVTRTHGVLGRKAADQESGSGTGKGSAEGRKGKARRVGSKTDHSGWRA